MIYLHTYASSVCLLNGGHFKKPSRQSVINAKELNACS